MSDAAWIETEGGGPATAGDHAYDRIRTDIIFGRLKPAQRLILDRLRTDYAVAIGTLREILSRLVPEGLVTAEGQRGFRVAPCSGQDFRELAALRLLVERSALAHSFEAGDVEWEGRVVAAHHKLARMEKALLGGDTSGQEVWKRYDGQFHQALVSACGSRAMLAVHAGICDRYLRYQMVFGIFRGAVAADEHRRLLECALARDVEGALALLDRHVHGCVEHAFENRLIR